MLNEFLVASLCLSLLSSVLHEFGYGSSLSLRSDNMSTAEYGNGSSLSLRSDNMSTAKYGNRSSLTLSLDESGSGSSLPGGVRVCVCVWGGGAFMHNLGHLFGVLNFELQYYLGFSEK